ncbi:MAG: lipopolysaccharide heptosyltransferase II [Candidatus Symbiodolus clandestinus]
MKILIIGPTWVGDMVMSQTLYRCLQQQYPQATLDVLAVDWCRPLLARMPEVHRALPMSIGHGQLNLGLRKAMGQQLRSECYQQAIVLTNSWKSALIPWFAKIPQRTGWRGEWRYGLLNDLRHLDPQRYPMQIQRYAALAYPKAAANGMFPEMLPWPQLTVTAKAIEQTKMQLGLPTEPKPIALAPGAAQTIRKCWPPRHYATLAVKLLQQGHWLLLLGAARDQKVCAAIQQQLPDTLKPRCFNYAGQTSLSEVIDLLAGCQAIVSNDSGLMHVACALGIAVVALFGPTEPSYTPPLTLNRRILRAPPLEVGEPHDPRDQGYHPRLIHLAPQQVFAELQGLLATDETICIS